MYFLGIDAGGTHCRARLTNARGHIIGSGKAGPANINAGIGNAFRAIETAYSHAIKQAQLDSKSIATIKASIGVAGINRQGAKQALQEQAFPFRSTKIHTDAYIANMGAHSGRDGGIVIIGTGSIALGRVNNRDIRVGGYGFPISDEGSGAYIGLHSIRYTLQAADGRIPHTQMTHNIFNLHGNHTAAIIGWMDAASPSHYAALAPMVVHACKSGDVYAQRILSRATEHVERMMQSLYSAGVPRCALTGGLAPTITGFMNERMRAGLVTANGDALDGALLSARQG